MRYAGCFSVGCPVTLVLALSGCGGADFGGDVRVPGPERYVLATGTAAGEPLALPGDRGFNIHVKQSSQNPGAHGTARGDSDASRDGKAFCRAEATGGGAASAEFKIGHRIDNRSEGTQLASISVEFRLNESVEICDAPKGNTLAKAELFLVVLDSRKRVVSTTTIIQTDSDQAVGRTEGPQQRLISARLEPAESYDVMLFGRAEAVTEADAPTEQKAAARIEIDQVRMNLSFARLATQPAG